MIGVDELETFFAKPDIEAGIRILEKYFGRERVDVWLKSPSGAIEGKTPQSLIDNGCEKIVANLIADMLSGSPS